LNLTIVGTDQVRGAIQVVDMDLLKLGINPKTVVIKCCNYEHYNETLNTILKGNSRETAEKFASSEARKVINNYGLKKRK